METYTRNESKLHNAPVSILYINMVLCIVYITLIMLLVVSMINKSKYDIIINVSLLLIVTIYSVFSDIYYNYYENAIIKFENNNLIYEYDLNRDFIPASNPKVHISIKGITKVKKRFNKARVYGTIIKKQPLGKQKHLKYCDIVIDNFSVTPNELINKIKELKESK